MILSTGIYLTMCSTERVSFATWLKIIQRYVPDGKCENGCCNMFRLKRRHKSELPEFKFMLN